MTPSDEVIAALMLDLALRRGRGKTFCPSDVARGLAADWRPLMGRVRMVAASHADIEAVQKGEPVDPLTARGPIRLRLR
ncbi:DUF3253 domain-containing protein [Fuscovulum ytuae]|uniref:DUF3253 domain-containing protein n=1 Tax=Fuscovulum ytuae TaxID=3042299 RepID=A0ABY8Q6C6_9RHOB|nr:DUF3253 domain-containing protein [Fuscovulum sp. YMD61]WGV15837.1 DUF3253 domain-containing protein [Fuscovulum sp. YMD61]